MKTILYCENNTDGTVGGSYKSLLCLVSELDRSRFRPIVTFRQDNPLIEDFLAAGIETHVLPKPVPARVSETAGTGIGLVTARAIAWLPLKLLNFFKLLLVPVFRETCFLRRRGVDLVHLNNFVKTGNTWIHASRAARIPCIAHVRGIGQQKSSSKKVQARFLSAIICVSNAVRTSLISIGVNHPRTETIHNGLDPAMMEVESDPETIRSRLGMNRTGHVIGIVGNLKQWKGQDVVIRAMALLTRHQPDLYCMIVGNASASNAYFEKQLHDMVETLGLEQQVKFTGYQKNVADFVNAVDVLVHASVRPEPFGRVLLEGMALRKPIVASRAGGVNEIIADGESGILYAPGKHEELAAAILKLLNDPDLASAIGEAGYDRLVTEFGIDTHVNRVQQLYDTLFQE